MGPIAPGHWASLLIDNGYLSTGEISHIYTLGMDEFEDARVDPIKGDDEDTGASLADARYGLDQVSLNGGSIAAADSNGRERPVR